jgi:hypothetical protein
MKKPLDQQACATCRCWVAEPGAGAGLCKRFPPVVVVVADELASAYPSTTPDDICGEYARRLQS